MKLMEALGFESWDELAELANAPGSYRMMWINCYLYHVNPDLYSLEEWNVVLKAVRCQEARTPTDAKNTLSKRMSKK